MREVRCPTCRVMCQESTIFIHILDCEKDVRHTARQIIKELERELGEQG